MTNPFFHSDLSLLHEFAAEFASANPALAPLLDDKKTDPDVERLLEAVAFQNAMLRRKLADDFPELIKTLVQLILPHYLRPIPATTLIGFTPGSGLEQTITIPAGTQFASAPVDGTACRFTTTAAVELHPLRLSNATFTQLPGRMGEIRLDLALQGLPLSQWRPKSLRLFLGGDQATASELYLLLSRHVSRIILTPRDGGADCVLSANCLRQAGFIEGEELLSYPSQAFPGYRLLQEYFSTPQKFLCFDLDGWEQWRQRGEGSDFTVSFELESLSIGPQRIRSENFILHAVPAINLFAHDGDPVVVNHRSSRYPIRPSGPNPVHCQIFSVDRVTGYTRASGHQRDYLPFELFGGDINSDPIYHLQLAQSRQHGGYDVHIGLNVSREVTAAEGVSLSIDLTCTNGSLPEKLRVGDIREPLAALPDGVSACNITSINPGQNPPMGSGLLRQLTSHLYLNHLSLERVDHLKALLELYVFPGKNGAAGAANLKRIAGIESMTAAAGEQRINGIVMRGRHLSIRVRQDHFAGAGDMYLFGCVLDQFLGRSAAMNCYTRLELVETLRGGIWQWPPRLGNHPLH